MDNEPNVITSPQVNIPNTPLPANQEVAPANQDPMQKKFFSKKIIFLILGIIVAAEIAWAATMLLKPADPAVVPSSTPSDNVQVDTVQKTMISLTSDSASLKVGETFTVKIGITSSSNTDGADIIINYDPKYLSVEPVDESPVVLGSLYSDYPVNKIEKEGKIVVSGISSIEGGVVPNGLFGSIKFMPKITGNTQIKIDFQTDDTRETNIIAAGEGKDVLSEVQDLSIEILP